MSEKIITTKEEIVEAFRLWNLDTVSSPDKYMGDISIEKGFAERQADCFLEHLSSI